MRLRDSWRALVAVAALTAMLLVPAVYNGFPLVFSDSGAYLLSAVLLRIPYGRTIGYSLWIALMGHGTSLWAPILTQSVLLAALLVLLVRALAPRLPDRVFLFGILGLSLGTAVSLRASQLMPDIFAPIMILALYLAVAQRERLGRAGWWVVALALATSVTMHATHVVLAAGLLACYAIWGLRSPGSAGIRWNRIAHAALTLCTGLSLLLTINFLQARRVFVSPNGHVFLLGHLVESGLAARLLADECGSAHYQLCAHRSSLASNGAPMSSDAFVWGDSSPLYSIGGWAGSRDETWRILRGSLRRYPVRHLLVAIAYTMRQLGAVWSLDGLGSYDDVAHVRDVVAAFRGADLPTFLAARQQRGTLGLVWLAWVHVVVAALSGAVSLSMIVAARRGRTHARLDSALGFQYTVWLVLAGNAVLCANLSGVYDRYQTRLVWLLPLAVLLSLAERRWSAGSATFHHHVISPHAAGSGPSGRPHPTPDRR